MRLVLRWFVGLLVLVACLQAEEKPDAGQVMRELEWLPPDYTTFEKLLARATAAELPEAATLLPQLDASLLFGDLEKMKALLPKTESAKAAVIQARGGTPSAKEEVTHSIKLAKQFLAFAEKRPLEVGRRAEIFRLVLFAHQTIEDARMLDAALDQLAIEKNLAKDAPATWEQVREYLTKNTHLHATGATLYGDKFGPFKIGTVPTIPRETYLRLKDYLPAEAWENFAPAGK